MGRICVRPYFRDGYLISIVQGGPTQHDHDRRTNSEGVSWSSSASYTVLNESAQYNTAKNG